MGGPLATTRLKMFLSKLITEDKLLSTLHQLNSEEWPYGLINVAIAQKDPNQSEVWAALADKMLLPSDSPVKSLGNFEDDLVKVFGAGAPAQSDTRLSKVLRRLQKSESSVDQEKRPFFYDDFLGELRKEVREGKIHIGPQLRSVLKETEPHVSPNSLVILQLDATGMTQCCGAAY